MGERARDILIFLLKISLVEQKAQKDKADSGKDDKIRRQSERADKGTDGVTNAVEGSPQRVLGKGRDS